ncbi:MAG: hypothetical protein Q9178_007085 [Gyalolechia marmorata]
MAEIIGITIAIAQITPAIVEYIRKRQLQQVAHALERAATSKREALKWPFERKAVAETLTNLERYKTAFLLALQTVQTEVSDSIRRGIQDIGSDVRQSREAVEWLRDSQQDKDYQAMLHLTYVFCTFKDRANQTAEDLFGSIVKQLAEGYPKRLSPLVKELYQTREKTHERPLLADFVSMLGPMLRSFRINYMVVDALDECADEVKDSLLNSFETLQQICSLRLLFTLRPGTITGLLDLNKTGFLDICVQDEDIGKYISSRISNLFYNGRRKDKQEVKVQCEDKPFLDYAGPFWGFHTRMSGPNAGLTSKALAFMKLDRNLSCATQVAQQEFMFDSWAKYPTDGPVLAPVVVVAYFGLTDVATSLLDHGANANVLARPPDGVSVLDIACQKGHRDVVKLLLDRGAITQRQQFRKVGPLHRAASFNHPAVVEVLLKHSQALVHDKNFHGKTALHNAAERGLLEVVQLLIEHGADLGAKSITMETPLSYAASSGNISCVQALLDAGVPLDHDEAGVKQATYTAAAHSQRSVLQWLYEKGAVVDVRGWHDNNALHGTVCDCADPAIIRLIMQTAIKQGKTQSVLNARNVHGKTPIMDAVGRNRLAAVSVILQYDPIDLEVGDNDGRTALHWAVSRNLPAMTKLLLEKSRSATFVNKRAGPMFKNMTALEMAVDKRYVEIIKIISEVL